MTKKLAQFIDIMRQDPAIAKVTAFYGGGSNSWSFAVLKPLAERRMSAKAVTYGGRRSAVEVNPDQMCSN